MNKRIWENIRNQTNLTTDIGIKCDINAFFQGDSRFKQYDVRITEDKRFIIKVQLKEYELVEAKSIFFMFLEFIQYPEFNCYIRRDTGVGVEFALLSADENLNGFCCIISFE